MVTQLSNISLDEVLGGLAEQQAEVAKALPQRNDVTLKVGETASFDTVIGLKLNGNDVEIPAKGLVTPSELVLTEVGVSLQWVKGDPTTGERYLVVRADIMAPKIGLAFEYQGQVADFMRFVNFGNQTPTFFTQQMRANPEAVGNVHVTGKDGCQDLPEVESVPGTLHHLLISAGWVAPTTLTEATGGKSERLWTLAPPTGVQMGTNSKAYWANEITKRLEKGLRLESIQISAFGTREGEPEDANRFKDIFRAIRVNQKRILKQSASDNEAMKAEAGKLVASLTGTRDDLTIRDGNPTPVTYAERCGLPRLTPVGHDEIVLISSKA